MLRQLGPLIFAVTLGLALALLILFVIPAEPPPLIYEQF